MSYYLVKIAVTTVLVVLISEISKRSSLLGALIASVPLISVLAIMWLYVETRDAGRVASLAQSIFWLVLPSLTLFLVLPPLLHRGYNFYLSLLVAIVATVVSYYLTIGVIRRFGSYL
jgi:hypothetical protein